MSLSVLINFEQELPTCAICGDPVPEGNMVLVLEVDLSKLDESWGNNREVNDQYVMAGDHVVDYDWTGCHAMHHQCFNKVRI